METTRYKKSIVRNLKEYSHSVLKKPSSAKIGSAGRYVKKGKLKDAEVYTLTLIERETCPTSCGHWDDCYGNNMPFAHRLQHGEELERRLIVELGQKCSEARKKGRKVLVRLHVLGDFYSAEYVRLWRKLLVLHQNLHVWGYTHVVEGPIHRELKINREHFPERWAVRWSDTGGTFSANSEELTGDGIVCPEQEGKTQACTTCALCWDAPDKNIIFKTH
tara:strand:+ start:1226 stop:1882 length:657 start_codon:yes stop_codon:yes gene_type:complete